MVVSRSVAICGSATLTEKKSMLIVNWVTAAAMTIRRSRRASATSVGIPGGPGASAMGGQSVMPRKVRTLPALARRCRPLR